jgi:hypothetical protein
MACITGKEMLCRYICLSTKFNSTMPYRMGSDGESQQRRSGGSGGGLRDRFGKPGVPQRRRRPAAAMPPVRVADAKRNAQSEPLVITLYSPKSHWLSVLRNHAERIEPRLIEAWPRDTKFTRRSFTRLDRAYVDARYSSHYEITPEELAWLAERIKASQGLVRAACQARLNA